MSNIYEFGDAREVVATFSLSRDSLEFLLNRMMTHYPGDGFTRDLQDALNEVDRRQEGEVEEEEETLVVGELSIDPQKYQVLLRGCKLRVTSTEFHLLHFLMKNRKRVVSHQKLGMLFDNTSVVSRSRLVKKYIQRLRDKLGDDSEDPIWIANIHGVGYRFIGSESTADLDAGDRILL